MNKDEASLPQHNHQRKLLELVRQGRLPLTPGTVREISIFHDKWCRLINGRGACNCDPDVRISWVIPAGADN